MKRIKHYLEGLVLAGFLIGIILGLFGTIFLGVSAIARYQCHNWAANTTHQVRYNYWSMNCYVKTANGWFEYQQINQTDFSK